MNTGCFSDHRLVQNKDLTSIQPREITPKTENPRPDTTRMLVQTCAQDVEVGLQTTPYDDLDDGPGATSFSRLQLS